MSFEWLTSLLRTAKRQAVKNAPHILMGLGTGCSVTAVIFAAKATPDATQAVREAEYEKGDALTKVEVVKAGAKYYIPAALMEALALASFWCAHGIDIRRQAVTAGLLSAAQEALVEYERKVKEMIGEKAEKEVHNAIAQDQVDRNPPPTTTVILPDDAESWWIIDGQYFRSTYSAIKDAQNQANHHMIQHMYLSKSELYWLLDPMHVYLKTDGDEGAEGWNVDRLLVLDIDWATDPNHRPVGVIQYRDTDGCRYPALPGYSAGL